MVRVKLWGSLRKFTNGAETVEIDAQNFKQLLDSLANQFPGLQAEIDRGVSMALDGVIYREAWFTPISPDSEVVLLPLMEGG